MDGIKPVVDRYIEIWNETDPIRRRALIALTWTEDAIYLDPLMSGEGTDEIDAMIQAAQERVPPGHRFRRTGEVDDHHDRVRFSWELVPDGSDERLAAGTDVAQVAADGRLKEVTGFLDLMPTA